MRYEPIPNEATRTWVIVGFLTTVHFPTTQQTIYTHPTHPKHPKTHPTCPQVQHSFPQMDVLFGNANDASALKALVEANEAVELFWMPFGSINLLELATSRSSTLLRSWDPYKDNMWQNIFVERVAPPTDPATKVVHYGFEEDGQSRLTRERVETQLGGLINLLSNKMEARVGQGWAGLEDGYGFSGKGV